jgi:hypothetical protein
MKKIKWIVIIVICCLVILLCVKRWNAWFGNLVEPDYESLNVPHRIQLTFGNTGQFSRNISWQCGDSLQTSILFLTKNETTDTISITAAGKVFKTTGGITVSYYAKIKELIAGAYSYSVCTGNTQSSWYSFKVGDETDKFSFLYFGDIQEDLNGNARQFFTNIHKREEDASFWIFGGDVVERPHDQYWNVYFLSMDSISQTVPIIAIPGNHEYLKKIPSKLEERFVYNFSYLIESQHKGHSVFNTTYGDMAIFTLDSNRDAWTLFSQNRWLKNALEQSKDKKWKIVVLHHPINSIRGRLRNKQIKFMFDSILKEYNVDMVLQGHEHGYARITNQEKTPIYVVGNSSQKNYRLYLNDDYERFGTGLRFYQKIAVNGDTLRLKTYTENEELYDDVCLVKTRNNTLIIDNATEIHENFDRNSEILKK